ncbi:PIN domain-containing protein [Klebsiella sp. HN106]|uniref:PIN domain-containing protein n=2 Tax=Klebsiella TaxID=570 RepID=UPI003EBAF08A
MRNDSPEPGKTYVMVDYENVQPSVSRFATRPETHFIIFVGHQQDRVNFDLASILQPLGERAEYVKIHGTGSNALDFHIALFVGKITQRDPSAAFVIVSNDRGYDPVISYLNASGTKIERLCVSAAPERKKAKVSHLPYRKHTSKRESHIKRIIRALNAMSAHAPKDRKALEGLIKSTCECEGGISNKELKRMIYLLTSRGLVNTHGNRFTYHIGNTKLKKTA